MALQFSKFEVMEFLWDSLPKTEDGEHVRYTITDLEQLWFIGFVDTGKFGLGEWKSVFDPYRRADASYILNKHDFLSLDKYRYKGEIKIPFDAMLINEGKYTNEGLDDLIKVSIAPSCMLEKSKISDFFNTLKKDFRQPDGLILIKKPAKERIAALLYQHPSPLRNLELLLDKMIKERGEEFEATADKLRAEAVTKEAAMQVSKFTAAPISKTEAKAKELKGLEKSRTNLDSTEIAGVEKVELKKVKRSRKGIRG